MTTAKRVILYLQHIAQKGNLSKLNSVPVVNQRKSSMNKKISSWVNKAIFYHIYPLGLFGAPLENDFFSPIVNRLERLHDWIPYMKSMGCNALYLGPVFESDFHGYDTADYCLVDRRLGTNETLKKLSSSLHENGIKLVLDTVFNHVGRNFWAFKDLQCNGENSLYKDWFDGVDFSRQSSYGDDFFYEGWYDAYNLVKLNLEHLEVKKYLFDVVSFWVDEFKIDGLRLDVAEIMSKQFLAELAEHSRALQPDLWLMGEVIYGDYNEWANPNMLDSTTNYQAYKGLYSCHNDCNYFEIAFTLNREFGPDGVYKDLHLYNFVDNHDTTRIASVLTNEQHMFPLHAILYTMPGIPSLYYGSEWGIKGIKGAHEDTLLRPQVDDIPDPSSSSISRYIQQLAKIKQDFTALQEGNYEELFVDHQQFAFSRSTTTELIVVLVNSAPEPVSITLVYDQDEGLQFQDQLAPEYLTAVHEQQIVVNDIPGYGARILTGKRLIEMV